MSENYLHGAQVLEINDGPRPVQAVNSSVIAIVGTAPNADPVAFPANTPVLVAGDRVKAAKLDTVGTGLGTLPQAVDGVFDQCGAVVTIVRVEEGADAAATQSNVIGGVEPGTEKLTGIQALLTAKNSIKVKPKILCAPGFDHVSAVKTSLVSIADRLKGFAYTSGGNTTHADAISLREQFGNKRLMICDPWVTVWDTDSDSQIVQPPSARMAGMRALLDNAPGWHRNISNNLMAGIDGIARDVDFEFGDPTCKANLLNEKHVTTIVQENGFRVWGPRTCSADPRWQYENVVRTSDIIGESIQRSALWAIDEGIAGDNFFSAVVDSVQAYLDRLKMLGMIIGGRCWADPAMNTPENIQNGQTFFDFDFTPVYPNEKMTFRSRMVNNYLAEIF